MLTELDITFPLQNPILKFFIILLIICLSPILTTRLKLPNLLGLILAGTLIGPYGLNLIERNDGIILSGTAGMLYILFLAGLEINSRELRHSGLKSLIFGLYTFVLPMVFGLITARVLLQFSWDTSVLLASMFASHTLISYPIIRKYGLEKDEAVRITVGGTIFTDTLALLILAVIVRRSEGNLSETFWIEMIGFITVYTFACLLLIPRLCRWFFHRYIDSDIQYIFILSIVFLGALLAEMIGLEGIIGAFVVGLALNRQVAGNHKLMSRIDFMGNSLFIPFFLIGIGMLIDFRKLLDLESLLTGLAMIITATGAKLGAAWLTQKSFGFSVARRQVIFGLSNAQAAATLAAVTVGYNIILSYSPDGEPVRLLNEFVLNGSILMILVTCTTATIYAEKGAAALSEDPASIGGSVTPDQHHVMVDIRSDKHLEPAINICDLLYSPSDSPVIHSLAPIDENAPDLTRYEKNVRRFSNLANVSGFSVLELKKIGPSLQSIVTNATLENTIDEIILPFPINGNLEGLSVEDLQQLQAYATLFGLRTENHFSPTTDILIYLPHSEGLSVKELRDSLSWLKPSAGRVITLCAPEKTHKNLKKMSTQYNLRSSEDIRDFQGILEFQKSMQVLFIIYHDGMSREQIRTMEESLSDGKLFRNQVLITVWPGQKKQEPRLELFRTPAVESDLF